MTMENPNLARKLVELIFAERQRLSVLEAPKTPMYLGPAAWAVPEGVVMPLCQTSPSSTTHTRTMDSDAA